MNKFKNGLYSVGRLTKLIALRPIEYYKRLEIEVREAPTIMTSLYLMFTLSDLSGFCNSSTNSERTIYAVLGILSILIAIWSAYDSHKKYNKQT